MSQICWWFYWFLSFYFVTKTDKETANVFNKFSSNITSNLNIPQYNQLDSTLKKIDDPVIKATVKYRTHPSVIGTIENCTSRLHFNFLFVEKEAILKEIDWGFAI